MDKLKFFHSKCETALWTTKCCVCKCYCMWAVMRYVNPYIHVQLPHHQQKLQSGYHSVYVKL